MRNDGPEEVGVNEGGRRLGLSSAAVSQWAKRADAPKVVRDGKTLLLWPQFPRWREELLAVQKGPLDLAKAQARKAAAQAELLEQQLAKSRGELHADGECLAAFGQVLDGLRAHLLTVPSQWAHRVVGLKSMVEAQGVLDAMIRGALTRLSMSGSGHPRDGAGR